MRNSVYRISLEMHDTASQALLNVKKNDSSRQVRISITDSGKPYKIEDGCTAKFRAKKPDGTILYNNCIIENDVIIYDLTNQTSAAAGLVDCEITLYGADFKQITSPRFAIYVDDTLYSDSEVESKDEFTALVTAEKTAVSAAQSAKEAETNANQSALLAEQYKNEAFKVTPAGFTEFVETTNDTLNEIGNLLGNTDISAIGDGTLTGGLDALNSNLGNCFIISPEYSDTVPSGTTNYYEPILTASIPDGYKLFAITGLRASLASIYFYSNGRRLAYNQIQIGLRSVDTSDLSGVVYLYRFIFIKENMISIH